jgi:hypothetical protein
MRLGVNLKRLKRDYGLSNHLKSIYQITGKNSGYLGNMALLRSTYQSGKDYFLISYS